MLQGRSDGLAGLGVPNLSVVIACGDETVRSVGTKTGCSQSAQMLKGEPDWLARARVPNPARGVVVACGDATAPANWAKTGESDGVFVL